MPLLPSRRAALLGLCAASACKPAATPLVSAKGQGVAVALPNDGTARLSTFSMPETVIDHILRWDDTVVSAKQGDYYPDSPSPAFQQLDAEQALLAFQESFGDKVKALINCSFFERYDPVTELSFPIKRAGKVITGGSSPYGPRSNPADPRYASVVLKALVWNDKIAKVLDYDHRTGTPLNDDNFENGLVTYRYEDHPANILAGDPVGQYQLLGVRQDGTLLVLTITKGRMAEGGVVLKDSGAIGSILTVDGGPSTHLWTKTNGIVIATKSVSLPHYLGFRTRA